MPTYHRNTAEAVERIAFLPQRMRVVQRQWKHLYDREEHICLRSAIANELDKLSKTTLLSYYLTFVFFVDEDGYIKYPMVGKLQVAGMTRDALALKIETELAKKEYVKEPNIQVRFLQLKVNVMGEVKAPGTKTFSADRITILDAIAAAGDLSDRGRRDNITVIREEAGQKKSYQVNLLNTDFINSPVFQLQQNDVVYVNANYIKLKETNFDPQVQRDLQIGLSVASGLSFLINLFLLFKR
jgi:polysaccharide export outer membrane protein